MREQFIEFFKDHNHGYDNSYFNTGREILSVSRIIHIYVVEADRTSLCVEYLGRNNEISKIYESFKSQSECISRFNTIKRILCESKED